MGKDVIQISGGITKYVYSKVKKGHVCEKDYVWNPATYSCQNGKYLASIMDDLAIICDEVIESYNEEPDFNEKKATCKMQNFYIYLHSY